MADIVEDLRKWERMAKEMAAAAREAVLEIEWLRSKNDRMRAALERVAAHDLQALAMDALRPNERIRTTGGKDDDA